MRCALQLAILSVFFFCFLPVTGGIASRALTLSEIVTCVWTLKVNFGSQRVKMNGRRWTFAG